MGRLGQRRCLMPPNTWAPRSRGPSRAGNLRLRRTRVNRYKRQVARLAGAALFKSQRGGRLRLGHPAANSPFNSRCGESHWLGLSRARPHARAWSSRNPSTVQSRWDAVAGVQARPRFGSAADGALRQRLVSPGPRFLFSQFACLFKGRLDRLLRERLSDEVERLVMDFLFHRVELRPDLLSHGVADASTRRARSVFPEPRRQRQCPPARRKPSPSTQGSSPAAGCVQTPLTHRQAAPCRELQTRD